MNAGDDTEDHRRCATAGSAVKGVKGMDTTASCCMVAPGGGAESPQRTRRQFVLPGERGLHRQKLMLKANLVLGYGNQCVGLLRHPLHAKHVKAHTPPRARAGLR